LSLFATGKPLIQLRFLRVGQGDFRLVLYDLLFLDALTRILFEYMLRDQVRKKIV